MPTRYGKEPFQDVDRTLEVMAELAQREKTSPQVRRTADNLTRGLSAQHDRQKCARRIWAFLRREIRYLLDPPGTELVQSPTAVLQSGHADCDGMAALAAAMMAALGIESGFRVLAWERPGQYEHVYALYAPRQGAKVREWHALDPVEPSPEPGPDTIRRDAVDQRTYTLAQHQSTDTDMPNLTDQTPVSALGSTRTAAPTQGGDLGQNEGPAGREFDSFAEFAAFALSKGPEYIEAWRQTDEQPADGVTDEELQELLRQAKERQAGFGGDATTVLLGAGLMGTIIYAATR